LILWASKRIYGSINKMAITIQGIGTAFVGKRDFDGAGSIPTLGSNLWGHRSIGEA
jgi:hypothetical protein